MKPRIAVIIPPIEDFYFTDHRNSGLGARILTELLKNSGAETVFINFIGIKGRKGKKHTIPLPAQLHYLKPYLQISDSQKYSRDGFFKSYTHFGPSYDECAEQIKVFCPHAAVISLFAFAYSHESIVFAKKLRSKLPMVPLIIGGAGVSVFPDYFLKQNLFALVCSGEAEVIAREVYNAVSTGISAKNTGCHIKASRITKPDELYPAWHMSKKRTTILTTTISRGCPNRCSFCSNHITHGRGFRFAHTEKWLELLPKLNGSEPVDINLEDDNLLYDQDRLFLFLAELRSRYPYGKLLMENGVDFRLLNVNTIKRLINSGMSHFNISLGSTGALSKGENDERNISRYSETVELINESGGWSTTYFIPGDRNDTAYNTGKFLGFLAGKKTQIGISMFYAVPGIKGFEDKNIFNNISPILTKGSSAYPWTKALTTNDLITAFLLARWINRTSFYSNSPLHPGQRPQLPGEENISIEVINGYLDGICSS